jgi:hypothetical protein
MRLIMRAVTFRHSPDFGAGLTGGASGIGGGLFGGRVAGVSLIANSFLEKDQPNAHGKQNRKTDVHQRLWPQMRVYPEANQQ